MAFGLGVWQFAAWDLGCRLHLQGCGLHSFVLWHGGSEGSSRRNSKHSEGAETSIMPGKCQSVRLSNRNTDNPARSE